MYKEKEEKINMKLIIAEKKELALHIFNYLKTIGEVGEIKGSYIDPLLVQHRLLSLLLIYLLLQKSE